MLPLNDKQFIADFSDLTDPLHPWIPLLNQTDFPTAFEECRIKKSGGTYWLLSDMAYTVMCACSATGIFHLRTPEDCRTLHTRVILMVSLYEHHFQFPPLPPLRAPNGEGNYYLIPSLNTILNLQGTRLLFENEPPPPASDSDFYTAFSATAHHLATSEAKENRP